VDFDLYFETWGADVIGILPVDSRWDYHSNGLMEREYLDGIRRTGGREGGDSQAVTAAVAPSGLQPRLGTKILDGGSRIR
jgi:hypothetical protein